MMSNVGAKLRYVSKSKKSVNKLNHPDGGKLRPSN